jgi:hypothetical protein
MALALVVALATVWYNAGQQQRCRQLWGTDALRLIRHAATVHAWRVAPAGADKSTATIKETVDEVVRFRDADWRLFERREISEARGLSHIRQALSHDRVFDWDRADADEPVIWQYAMRFTGADGRATLLFSFDPPCVAQVENAAIASIAPAAEGFQAFLTEQFGRPASQR